MENDKSVWEILVPTVRNDGKPYRLRFHRVWDEKVRAISGGMTVCQPTKGHWVNPEGTLFVERMIPVRIIATDDQINQIIDYTLSYYEQEAVLAVKISSTFIIRHKSIDPVSEQTSR